MSGDELRTIAPVSHAIFRVARLHRSIAGRLLREAGLHPGQELVLMTLWASGPQRMVDLVNAIESDAPTMTRSVARLEEAGLVTRAPSPDDRRVKIIAATAASEPLRAKVEDAWSELERRTVEFLPGGGQPEALAGLRLLETSLTAAVAHDPQLSGGALPRG